MDPVIHQSSGTEPGPVEIHSSPVEGIDHVQLTAPPGCEEKGRWFFGELLGLPEVEKPAGLRARGGVWFQAGRQQVHVGVADPFVPAAKAHPAFRVRADGLDPLADRLEAAGVKVLWDSAIESVRRFFVADPWGNRIELLSGPEK
jgi:catechol 2,3-dioxygenase-like lactoylglutathione lyase family enzyme